MNDARRTTQGLPRLPEELAKRLAGAEMVLGDLSVEPEELVRLAEAVIEAAALYPGRDQAFAVALGADEKMPWLPEWVMNLPLDLGRAGLGAEAAAVGDALGVVDADNAAVYAADVGVALAEAGDAAAARDRIADNLERWPDELWVRMHAGDALQALGDTQGAEQHFRAALEMAEKADDFEGGSDAAQRLSDLGHPVGPRTTVRAVGRSLRVSTIVSSPSSPSHPRPNDRCPCGSGRRYRRCHGRRRR
jgi:tetratricopeptide (TPR) repeat protein